MSKPIKTYVLAGHDDNEAYKIELSELMTRKGRDVEIIRAQPGETLQQAMRKIHPPANVLLAAHGGANGSFTWNEDETCYYSSLFKALPREGIDAVFVTGCYSETSVNDIRHVPAGTVVVPFVGAKSPTYNYTGIMWARETRNELLEPETAILEMYDNLPASKFAEWNRESNAERMWGNRTTNPLDIIPTLVGIGGRSSQIINLKDEITRLSVQGPALLQSDAFQHAMHKVSARFEVRGDYDYDPIAEETATKLAQTSDSRMLRGLKNIGDMFSDAADGLAEWTKERVGLDDKTVPSQSAYRFKRSVYAVAEQIANGVDPSDFDEQELRIGLSLAAAHLYGTCSMERLREGHTLAPLPSREAIADAVNGTTLISRSDRHLSKPEVMRVQRALKDLGMDLGTYGPNGDGVDGQYGSKTHAAFKTAYMTFHFNLDALTIEDLERVAGEYRQEQQASAVEEKIQRGPQLTQRTIGPLDASIWKPDAPSQGVTHALLDSLKPQDKTELSHMREKNLTIDYLEVSLENVRASAIGSKPAGEPAAGIGGK
jgi:hypothetical protein